MTSKKAIPLTLLTRILNTW